MWLSSSPDINEAVSLLLLELLDACNHFVVQPVSICPPDNQTHKVLHKLEKYVVTMIIFREVVLIQCVQIGMHAITDHCTVFNMKEDILPVNSCRNFPRFLLRSWSKTLAFW